MADIIKRSKLANNKHDFLQSEMGLFNKRWEEKLKLGQVSSFEYEAATTENLNLYSNLFNRYNKKFQSR